MRTLIFLAALAPSFAMAEGPSCAAVAKTLYGISLGAIQHYPDGLRKGLRREGTAQLIADVGIESVEGNTDEIVYPRIMAFFDRGKFTGTMAIGRIESEKDQGFARMVAAVAVAANSQPIVSNGRASFECEGYMELSLETTKWDDGPAVKIRVMDGHAHKQTTAYIEEYCADPNRRRPQDACKK